MSRVELSKSPLQLITAIALGSLLAITSLTAAQQAQAETKSADEAAWRQHLKHAHTKNGLTRNGQHDSNLVSAGWEVIPGGSEDTIILTSQDMRILLSAVGNKASRRPARTTDLRYQAEVGDELVQFKFFYNF